MALSVNGCGGAASGWQPGAMADDEAGPVFPAAPPERIELSGGRALVRWSPDRAAELAVSVNESLEHLRPWMAWAQAPASEASLAIVLTTGDQLWESRRDFSYTLVEGPDERVIGAAGLHGRHDEHALEIGYWVHVERIGQGLATEMSRALTDAAFGIPGIERVHIQCDERNVRSARVPEKLGYRYLGVSVPEEGVCAGRSTRRWLVAREDWMASRSGAAS
jgi:RimJ/RimL family protein N-acetyltransferase